MVYKNEEIRNQTELGVMRDEGWVITAVLVISIDGRLSLGHDRGIK